MLTVIIILSVVVVLYVLSGIKIISQSETMIIERLGKYSRTLSSGINVILPVIERARFINTLKFRSTRTLNGNVVVTATPQLTKRIDLREQVYDFPKQNVITKDNVQTEINALLYFQITNPVDAIYEIDNLPNAIEKLTQTTLRNVIGELELDETLTSRDTINAKLRSVLDDATNKWGVKVNRVELQDITPPESVREAMEQQMQAERKKRADILNAEGDKQAVILKSEGDKQSYINNAEADKAAAILRAEAQKQSEILHAEGIARSKILQADAEAAAIEKITEAVSKSKADPANYLLAVKYIDTLKEMTSGKDNKTVYIPYEASNVLGSIGGIKDLFKQ